MTPDDDVTEAIARSAAGYQYVDLPYTPERAAALERRAYVWCQFEDRIEYVDEDHTWLVTLIDAPEQQQDPCPCCERYR